MMAPEGMTTSFDEGSDVLYIARGNALAQRGVEDDNGIVWRYGADGALVGVTVLDFRAGWGHRQGELAEMVATRFQMSPVTVRQAVADALAHAVL
jgi:Protein of unknown function (DUF2283)